MKPGILVLLVLSLLFETVFCAEPGLIDGDNRPLGSVSAASGLQIEELVKPAIILAAGALLYTQDEAIHDIFLNIKSPFLDSAANFDYLGDGTILLPSYAALYLLGAEKEKDVAVNAIEAFVESGLIGIAIKSATGRARPPDGGNTYSFNPSFGDNSFPSGHTTVAFSTAAVIGGAYDCRLITYPIAALVGLGRIYKEKHWASDVFFGALLGSLVGEAHAAGMKRQAGSKLSFYVEPVNSGAIYGIKIRF